MKLNCSVNKEDLALSEFRIEAEEGEWMLQSHSVDFPGGMNFGTVYIPEGIEVIDKYTFSYMRFHTYYFPKSLTELRNNLFSIEVNYYSDKIKIVYAGTSEEFKKIAAVRKEEVCESGGFDRYPYYSGGSRWVTYYRCFDNEAADIEVDCSDGVTLLYGSRHRKDNEPPKVKE